MIEQVEITLQPKSRGFHLVTSEIIRQLPKLPKTGIIRSTSGRLLPTGRKNIFCKHTSCGLSINENADPDVRVDMETIFNRTNGAHLRLIPESRWSSESHRARTNGRVVTEEDEVNRPEYKHTLEGADDMPAHAKSTLSGVSLTIPITNGHLNMGNRLAASLVEEPGRASTSVSTGIMVEQEN